MPSIQITRMITKIEIHKVLRLIRFNKVNIDVFVKKYKELKIPLSLIWKASKETTHGDWVKFNI